MGMASAAPHLRCAPLRTSGRLGPPGLALRAGRSHREIREVTESRSPEGGTYGPRLANHRSASVPDMALSDLSAPAAVLRALEEYDDIGQAAFLDRYGFGRARSYFVIRDGQRYDSKAIAGAAHGYEFGRHCCIEERLAAKAELGEDRPTEPELAAYVSHLVATFDPRSCVSCSLFSYCRGETAWIGLSAAPAHRDRDPAVDEARARRARRRHRGGGRSSARIHHHASHRNCRRPAHLDAAPTG